MFAALDRISVAERAKDANKPPYKPELAAKVKDLSDRQSQEDPAFYCKPAGVPRMGAPSQILQMPGQVVFLYATNLFRLVPTDGRPHRTDIDTSYMGDSVGRWDGDTLVVDVNNLNDDTWLGPDGYFHTEAMHVVERLTRNGDTLTYQATVEDPNVFTKPWVMNRADAAARHAAARRRTALRREGCRAPRDARPSLNLHSQLPTPKEFGSDHLGSWELAIGLDGSRTSDRVRSALIAGVIVERVRR